MVCLYYPPGCVKKCNNPLPNPHPRCHTKDMNNETLSPEILALLADLESDLGVPLDFDPDEEVEPMGRFDGYPVF